MDHHIATLHKAIQSGRLPQDLPMYHHLMGLPSVQDVVMATNRHGDTAFHVAARHGHVTLLRELHERYHLSLDHTNSDGKSALHESAQNGHTPCVEYLIKAGCHVDSLKRADWTPLMLACTKNNVDVISVLIQKGASLKMRNKDGWTPFHIACREGMPVVLNLLLNHDSSCWDTVSKNGRTPLHTAALHGKTEATKLLQARCDFDIGSTDSCGVSPLMDAARGNHLETARHLILDWKADVHQVDVLGREALHVAAQAGSTLVLQLLVDQCRVNVNKAAGPASITPLHYAAKEGQSETISFLLSHGADATATDRQGRTALDIARTTRGGEEAVQILLSKSDNF